MNDPHVEWLKYRLKIHSAIVFENPPPLEHEEQLFRLHLEEDVLTVYLKEHYATVEAARAVVERFLKDWEFDAAINRGHQTITFEFQNKSLIDRNPLPKPPNAVEIIFEAMCPPAGIQIVIGSLPIKFTQYPEPPKRFKASPDVETMWFRYQGHIQGKEPLQAMSYFCLDLIERRGNGRKAVSKAYKIQSEILDNLGRLVSTKGTERDARKVESDSFIPLTDQEQRWICEAVKMLIRRKGEYDFEPSTADSLPQITMKDLPNLPASPK